MNRTWLYLIIAIIISTVNLGLLGPLLTSEINIRWANGVYLLIRVGTFIGLAYALARFCSKPRFQVISLITFIAFLEQVPLKILSISWDAKIRPEVWQGLPMKSLALELMVSYIAMIPVVMVLGFVGTELNASIHERPKTLH